MRRIRLVLTGAVLAIGVAAATAFATLPPQDADGCVVSLTSTPPKPTCVLAGKTATDIVSVSAFDRTFAEGTNVVITHNLFSAGQTTGWHTHPGPNVVVMIHGQLTLYDRKCRPTVYGPGQGFATGLSVHKADAGSEGAEFYSAYILPVSADVLRTPATAADASLTPNCAS
jgi:quercetin dioxygenase-like cupin family protein